METETKTKEPMKSRAPSGFQFASRFHLFLRLGCFDLYHTETASASTNQGLRAQFMIPQQNTHNRTPTKVTVSSLNNTLLFI